MSTFRGSLVRPVDAYYLSARVPDGGAARGLAALLAEGERAARFGFTQPELDRARAKLMRQWEQIYAERGKETSADFAGFGYVGHAASLGRGALHRHRVRAATATCCPASAWPRSTRWAAARWPPPTAPSWWSPPTPPRSPTRAGSPR